MLTTQRWLLPRISHEGSRGPPQKQIPTLAVVAAGTRTGHPNSRGLYVQEGPLEKVRCATNFFLELAQVAAAAPQDTQRSCRNDND